MNPVIIMLMAYISCCRHWALVAAASWLLLQQRFSTAHDEAAGVALPCTGGRCSTSCLNCHSSQSAMLACSSLCLTSLRTAVLSAGDLALQVRRTDVLSAWSGIRPLATDPNAHDTASASRDHVATVDPDGMLTITGALLRLLQSNAGRLSCTLASGPGAMQSSRKHGSIHRAAMSDAWITLHAAMECAPAGGKWTTYRKMAQDAIDLAVQQAGLKHASPCRTVHLPLVGAAGASPPPAC